MHWAYINYLETKLTTKILTMIIMGGATTSLVAWDIVAMKISGKDSTVSNLMAEGAHHTSVIPATFGFLGGHFFWPKENGRFSLGRSLSAAAVAIGSDVLMKGRKPSARAWRPVAALLSGIAAGYWAWPQKLKSEAS